MPHLRIVLLQQPPKKMSTTAAASPEIPLSSATAPGTQQQAQQQHVAPLTSTQRPTQLNLSSNSNKYTLLLAATVPRNIRVNFSFRV